MPTRRLTNGDTASISGWNENSHDPTHPCRAVFAATLTEPHGWLRESLAELGDADFDAVPFPGKWSYRGFIDHIVDLGWTDILYRAVLPHRPQYGAWDPTWKDTFEAQRHESIDAAIAVMEENHVQVATWIGLMSDEDFLHPFPGVLLLADAGLNLVVADSGRWGLYLHAYYHLAFMQRHRLAIDKPLPAMERYLRPCPGFDPNGAWPPWIKHA